MSILRKPGRHIKAGCQPILLQTPQAHWHRKRDIRNFSDAEEKAGRWLWIRIGVLWIADVTVLIKPDRSAWR